MSEKFSDYADVKQLLLERLVGDLQRRVDHRAFLLRRSRPWAWDKESRQTILPHEEGFEAAREAELSECDEEMKLAILGLFVSVVARP